MDSNMPQSDNGLIADTSKSLSISFLLKNNRTIYQKYWWVILEFNANTHTHTIIHYVGASV